MSFSTAYMIMNNAYVVLCYIQCYHTVNHKMLYSFKTYVMRVKQNHVQEPVKARAMGRLSFIWNIKPHREEYFVKVSQ